jgi:YfiH family protein
MFYSNKLKKIENINHCFFSRKNGFSTGIYKSLNCGTGSKDKKENIGKNLKYVSDKLGINFDNLILMNQTHSNQVIIIDKNNMKLKNFESDAIITKIKGLALSVLSADCVPIILYDKKNAAIGCIHAGWKGCASGIIENTLKKFNMMGETNDLLACIGPCIGKESYEVGDDVYKKFLRVDKENSNFFINKNDKKFLFDIRGFVQNKLLEYGVKDIDNIDLDTFQDPINFFSYRRSKKMKDSDYGRCISTICLKT